MYNPLAAEGTKAITDVLKYDGIVKDLKLGWCKLGVQGSVAVSDLLRFNTTLDTLDLRGNNFGNDGCIVLAQGMKNTENSHFKEVLLEYNEIKDDGAFVMAQARRIHYSIHTTAVSPFPFP